jgi:hypothetical protein
MSKVPYRMAQSAKGIAFLEVRPYALRFALCAMRYQTTDHLHYFLKGHPP